MKLVIAEKPSVAKAIAPFVGATIKKNGFIKGKGYTAQQTLDYVQSL